MRCQLVVGVISFDLKVCGAFNLKEKRSCVRSLVEKIRNRFNVSVAEVGFQDLWQRTRIGVSVVGNDTKVIESLMERISDFVYSTGDFEVLDRELDLQRY